MATKLRQLRINRVAHVDKGAGKGVEILLSKALAELPAEVEAYLKRDFTDDERKAAAASGAAMPGGGFPIENEGDLKNAIQAIGRAKDPDATKKHIRARAKALGLEKLIPDTWDSLGKKLTITHAADGKITLVHDPEPGEQTVDKRGRLVDLLDILQVAKASPDGDALLFDGAPIRNDLLKSLWDASGALNESIGSIFDDAEAVDKGALLQQTLEEFTNHLQDLVAGAVAKALPADTGETGMSTELKKALGLAEGATEAEVLAAVTKSIEAGNAAAAALAKAQAEANIAKMSQAHSDYCAAQGMDDDAKAAFAAKSADERDAAMAKNPVKKSAAEIELAKRDDEIANLKKRLDAQEDERALADITKRLEPLTHVGDTVAKAKELHAVSKVNPELAKSLESEFVRLNDVIKSGTLFREHGSNRQGVTKAADSIQTQAAELMQKTIAGGGKMTIEKARSVIRDGNPQLAEQERQENAQRSAA